MATKNDFAELGKWSIEALDEDNDRYFYHFSEVSLLYNGTKNYIIGRKGTGKTAIAEYISKRTKEKQQSTVLSFKNFKFNLLYALEDRDYTSPNQYITVWEYVILSAICELMSKSSKVNYDSRSELSKLFNIDLERSLSDSISKITDREFSFDILGIGGGVGSKVQSSSSVSLADKVKYLYTYIENNICDSSYFVIFDALDEDYKDILSDNNKEKYFHLLIGLFKASQNVRRFYRNIDRVKIIPLIFLRNDIFDLCRDPDKNKWLDRAIQLNWSHSQLQNLIDFRLSRAINPRANEASSSGAWKYFFTDNKIRVNSRHQRSEDVFKNMLRSTFNRPRDIVNYVRECACMAKDLDASRISSNIIRESNSAQSVYMRREINDEMYSILENISEILDLLSNQRKSIFSQQEFISIYTENFRDVGNGLSARDVLKILYHFNVVGNITTGSHQVFSYNSSSKSLNVRENVCIHRGIIKSLDIY
jgi:hypothetical protein